MSCKCLWLQGKGDSQLKSSGCNYGGGLFVRSFVQMLMANDNEDNVLIVVFSGKWDHTNKLVPKDHHSRFNLIVASHIVRR